MKDAMKLNSRLSQINLRQNLEPQRTPHLPRAEVPGRALRNKKLCDLCGLRGEN
jgi:hypothetical protein